MKRLFAATFALALSGCSFIVGSLSECSTDADCAAKGADLVCQDSLCVSGGDAGPAVARDPLCQKVSGDPSAGTVIRLGAIFNASVAGADGGAVQSGVLREQAVQLAAEQVNAKHALPNATLVLRICDDQGDAQKASTEAAELADEGALGVVTGGSSETLAIGAVMTARGGVVVSASATSTQIQSAGVLGDGGAKRVWSTAPSDALQGQALAYQMGDNGYQKPWVIQRDDIAFNGLYDATAAALLVATDGGVALQRAIYEPGADVSAAVAQAQAGAPDAVLIIAPPAESTPILNAWAASGVADPPYLFTDNSRQAALTSGVTGGVARLAGSIGTGPSSPPATDPVYSLFSSIYRAEFSVDPATSSYVANSYDAVLLLSAGALWAQNHGAVTGPAVAQGLTELSDTTQAAVYLTADHFTDLQRAFAGGSAVNVQGASGALDFDATTGVAPGAIDVWTVATDGGLVTIETHHL